MDETEKVDHERLWKAIQAIRSCNMDPENLKKVLENWDAAFGPEYFELAEEVLARNVREEWSKVAAQQESNSIDDLVRIFWEDWTEGEFTITRTEKQIKIHCTKCPLADNYLSIGRKQEGLVFQCSEDPHIVAGFNPKMKFCRTKTLMNSDDCCDHIYSMD